MPQGVAVGRVAGCESAAWSGICRTQIATGSIHILGTNLRVQGPFPSVPPSFCCGQGIFGLLQGTQGPRCAQGVSLALKFANSPPVPPNIPIVVLPSEVARAAGTTGVLPSVQGANDWLVPRVLSSNGRVPRATLRCRRPRPPPGIRRRHRASGQLSCRARHHFNEPKSYELSVPELTESKPFSRRQILLRHLGQL